MIEHAKGCQRIYQCILIFLQILFKMIKQQLKKFKVEDQPRSIVQRNVMEDLLNKRKMLEDEKNEEEQVLLSTMKKSFKYKNFTSEWTLHMNGTLHHKPLCNFFDGIDIWNQPATIRTAINGTNCLKLTILLWYFVP